MTHVSIPCLVSPRAAVSLTAGKWGGGRLGEVQGIPAGRGESKQVVQNSGKTVSVVGTPEDIAQGRNLLTETIKFLNTEEDTTQEKNILTDMLHIVTENGENTGQRGTVGTVAETESTGRSTGETVGPAAVPATGGTGAGHRTERSQQLQVIA